MAKKRKQGPNQSQFIRNLFATNPKATLGDAKNAWAEAGNKGELGNSLFYVVKRKAGLTAAAANGKRRGRPVGKRAVPAVPARRSAAASGYEAVEERLDDVIRMLWELGDHALAAEFRGARRKIAAKLV